MVGACGHRSPGLPGPQGAPGQASPAGPARPRGPGNGERTAGWVAPHPPSGLRSSSLKWAQDASGTLAEGPVPGLRAGQGPHQEPLLGQQGGGGARTTGTDGGLAGREPYWRRKNPQHPLFFLLLLILIRGESRGETERPRDIPLRDTHRWAAPGARAMTGIGPGTQADALSAGLHRPGRVRPAFFSSTPVHPPPSDASGRPGASWGLRPTRAAMSPRPALRPGGPGGARYCGEHGAAPPPDLGLEPRAAPRL